MECVWYADRSFDYEVRPVAEMGCQFVESCLLNGRDLLSEAGCHHFRSMDGDPKEIAEMLVAHGLRASGL